jgi:pimeloyl-ACP methyl ester carboxylesterase
MRLGLFDESAWKVEGAELQATAQWLEAAGDRFSAGPGRSGCARLTNYSVNYREWGEGPPLVLVPGLAGGFGLLGPLARLLATRFRVISYQLRGEDDCFALRQRFGLRDLVNDLAEFIEWHNLERPAVLGVSFGGVLALEFAARYPNRLEELIIQGAGARLEKTLLQQIAGIILSKYPLPSDNAFVNQFFNLLFGGRQNPGPLFEFVTQQCWQTDQGVMAHRLRLVEDFNLGRRLEQIRARTLVMVGDRDLLVSEQSLRALYQGVATCKFVRLARCGHLAFVTDPNQVANEVTDFLRQPSS